MQFAVDGNYSRKSDSLRRLPENASLPSDLLMVESDRLQEEGGKLDLTHGGDITGYFDEYGSMPLDFSSNVSSLGLPPEVREAVIAALDRADEYPDPRCRRLVEAIAAHEGAPTAHVLCGNGSADLIYRLALAVHPARALMPAPTFSEYADALSVAGAQIWRHRLDTRRGFDLDEGFLSMICEGVDMVFVCQPNNPTGTVTPLGLMMRVLDRCEEVGARLVVDECFVPFLEDAGSVSVAGLVAGHPALVVLKAFTKVYAMPGIRLGYLLCSDGELLRGIERAGQPWSVSNLAQAAGIAALGCTRHVEETREVVARERAFLLEGLSSLGVEAQGSANFLFFQLADGGALTQAMRQRGILIRDCSNYEGLGAGSYRVAVKSREDNRRLLDAMRDALAGGLGAFDPAADMNATVYGPPGVR